jgi:aspartate carbamoyltransferase catalytic subunit
MQQSESGFRGQHVLSAKQFSAGALASLLELAGRFDAAVSQDISYTCFQGKRLRTLFFEESTRTISTFEEAFQRLGGTVHHLRTPKEESPEDMARVTTASVHCAVMRHPETGFVERFAAVSSVPVINGGNGEREHPTQALLDLYTIEQELRTRGRKMDGATIAIFGDLEANRAAHSLIVTLSLYANLRFVLASPGGRGMPQEFVEFARACGSAVEETVDPGEALRCASVVYATRFKRLDEMTVEQRRQAEAFRLNRAILERHGAADAIIMHPMPRSEKFGELSTDLDGLPNFAMFRQARNGLPVRMALLVLVLGVEGTLGW